MVSSPVVKQKKTWNEMTHGSSQTNLNNTTKALASTDFAQIYQHQQDANSKLNSHEAVSRR